MSQKCVTVNSKVICPLGNNQEKLQGPCVTQLHKKRETGKMSET